MDRTKDACRHQSNNRVIMWYKIRELYLKGFNKSQIAFQLGLHRSTVRRYLKMDEDTLTAKLQHRRRYPRILDKYESYVCDVLSRYRFLSASQIHDWMKEQYPDLPVVCGKTVYNFVETVRRKYNLDKEGLSKRVYEKMPDTPYGEYAQMDFGESRMPTYRNDFVKVYFFVMVMSRSRQKFVYFSCTPFTSALAVYAHELAFAYFGGKPRRIIYDQDKVLLVRENLGDLILTRTFRAFVNEQHFQPVFCRPADPESKGKVENMSSVTFLPDGHLTAWKSLTPRSCNGWKKQETARYMEPHAWFRLRNLRLNGNICCHTMENRCPPKTSRKSIMSARTIRYGTGPTTTACPPAPIKIGTPLYGYLRITDISSCTTKRAVNSYAGMSCVPEKGKMYVTKDIIRTRHGV